MSSQPSQPGFTAASLLTPDEAARLLRVHPSSIWRWIARGKLTPAVRVGAICRLWTHDLLTMSKQRSARGSAGIASIQAKAHLRARKRAEESVCSAAD